MSEARNNATIKIVILSGAVIIALFAYKAMIGGARQDVFGFSPGMPREDADKIISKRQWVCETPDENSLDCKTEAGQVRLAFAGALKGKPVYAIHASLNRRDLSPEEIAKSVSKQFGREPTTGGADKGGHYVWDLPNGSTLKLDGTELQMTNKALADRNGTATTGSVPAPPAQ